MAVMLLAQDGKLSLDDQVRKHIPELPDYGVPLTIRHMLTHTSGLRDWGSVAGIAGCAAHHARVHARARARHRVAAEGAELHAGHAVVVQQHRLQPGRDHRRRASAACRSPNSRSSASSRRSGMTQTSWRDDHTRIVKGRAIAYATTSGGYHIEMPFENVHGNGGLLTTVGDLLKWNENYVTPQVGDAAFVGRAAEGRQVQRRPRARVRLGLYVRPLDGVHNIYHSGSTAGYRAHLNRFPRVTYVRRGALQRQRWQRHKRRE